MSQILIDRLGKLSFSDGLVRIECLATGADGKLQVSGTLLMPGAQAGKLMQSLAKSLQELGKKVKPEVAGGGAS